MYSSDVRFLFEMLQNCEDNQYQSAIARGEQPTVLFQLHPDHIVIDCNEDGFTRANLEAICEVGKSSKAGNQAYVGEKGIGFKSVFTVAYKAVIQSGHASFSFTHNKGEMGLGMVSPHWEDGLLPVKTGNTRITLSLRQDDDASDVFEHVKQQAEELQGEMLLFMRNLKVITVEFYDKGGTLERSLTYSTVASRTSLVKTLETEIDSTGNETRTTKDFFFIRHAVLGLPRSEDRGAMSEIILAFPLEPDCKPHVDPQFLFSFLPVARVGFKVSQRLDCLAQPIVTFSSSSFRRISSLLRTEKPSRQPLAGTLPLLKTFRTPLQPP